MQGKRLLHLGHLDADCDALGSAYAVSRILPGVLGFAGRLKNSVQDLVVSECQQVLVEHMNMDLAGLMADLAQTLDSAQSWGTRSMGRVVASLPVNDLLERCVQVIVGGLLENSPVAS